MPLGKVFPSGVTDTSTTLSDIAAKVGEVRWEDGMRYLLVKSGAAITDECCCKLHSTGYETVNGRIGLIVVITADTTDDFQGVTVCSEYPTCSCYFQGQE